MTIQERIKRNREMEARIEARKIADQPRVDAALDRKIGRLLSNFYRALPAAEKRPFLEAASRGFRPEGR